MTPLASKTASASRPTGSFAPSTTYAYARYSLGDGWSGLKTIPMMLVLGCGLCVNNTLAVFRGLFSQGGEFVRTPKSGSVSASAKSSSYQVAENNLWIAEIGLGIYSLASFILYFGGEHRAFSFFLLIYAIGFCTVGWLSKPQGRRRTEAQIAQVPAMVRVEVQPVESRTSVT